jgi:hypothetical protein
VEGADEGVNEDAAVSCPDVGAVADVEVEEIGAVVVAVAEGVAVTRAVAVTRTREA